jgi:hypothetical protein
VCGGAHGVWNWKTRTEDDESITLQDFEEIRVSGRRVVLMFDSDARSNANVRLALSRLADMLIARGAQVETILPPDGPNGEKQGIDDFLGGGGIWESLWQQENRLTSVGFDSWDPLNLSTLGEREQVLPDLAGTLAVHYPGKRHVVSGPPESFKTMIEYAALLEALRNGKRVGIVNFEMDDFDARDMFRDLGATDDELASIVFISPERKPTDEDIKRVVGYNLDIVVIDAGAGVYELEETDDNKRVEVEKMARKWITPLWRAGVATVLLDHQAKTRPGAWAIGSERKIGQADVHLRFEAKQKLVRGGEGVIRIHVEKDRPGHIRAKYPHGADIHLRSNPQTHALTYEVEVLDGKGGADDFRPTALMQRVSKYLESHQGDEIQKTKRQICEAVRGKKKWTLRAVDLLVEEGYAGLRKDGRAHRIYHVKPYSQNAEEHGLDALLNLS